MSLRASQFKSLELAFDSDVDLSSYAQFINSFPLKGEDLYKLLFSRNSHIVRTQKEKFAIANLARIFDAAFDISVKSGFDKMSLRDLSRQAKMSMGAIYSCISKKEDIAVMVSDIVRLSGLLIRQQALKTDDFWLQIETSIRSHLYASSVLQPWYFFLYFETRSLPELLQIESMKIELQAVAYFQELIEKGIAGGECYCEQPEVVANMLVVLLQDWYLKPWKIAKLADAKAVDDVQNTEKMINYYNASMMTLLHDLLDKPSTTL